MSPRPRATDVPDLTTRELAVDLRGCPELMRVHARLVNEGWAAAPVGVPVTFYVDVAGCQFRIGAL